MSWVHENAVPYLLSDLPVERVQVMWELAYAPKLPTTWVSTTIRAMFFLIMGGGWALWAFEHFDAGDTHPAVWVLAMSVVIGLPLLGLTAKIEQYYCHAIWGIGFQRAFRWWLNRQEPEVIESFNQMTTQMAIRGTAVRNAMEGIIDE